MASAPEREAHRLRNGLIWTIVLLGLLLAIGLAVPDLRGVLTRAAHANLAWMLVAVGLELLSCLSYVAVVRLVLHRGPAGPVRSLAWAEMAFGAVVPVGGAGGLAVGAWAMRAWGSAWSRIANRSAVIFLLTSGFNALVLALGGLGVMLGVGNAGRGLLYGLIPLLAGAGAIAGFALLPVLARRLGRPRRRGRALVSLIRQAGDWVGDTEALARRRDWRLSGTAGYLLFDIAVLWACLRAVGASPPVMALVVGYQIGYLANLIPIPGGVGVLEGGLLGALLLYGLPAAQTAAAVVIYHAIALWVPTIGGTIGFARLRRAVSEQGALREAAAAAERSRAETSVSPLLASGEPENLAA